MQRPHFTFKDILIFLVMMFVIFKTSENLMSANCLKFKVKEKTKGKVIVSVAVTIKGIYL